MDILPRCAGAVAFLAVLISCMPVQGAHAAPLESDNIASARAAIGAVRSVAPVSESSYNETVRNILMGNVSIDRTSVATGLVRVSLLIQGDGHVQSFDIDRERTVASKDLVKAVERAARISVFPPLPEEIRDKSPLKYSIDIRFGTANSPQGK